MMWNNIHVSNDAVNRAKPVSEMEQNEIELSTADLWKEKH